VIEGLKLDISAAELTRRLSETIASHESRVSGCEHRLRRLGEIERAVDLDPIELGWEGGYSNLRAALERKRTHHRDRALVLTFLRDHLVAGEVYRLSQEDLRLAEVIPQKERPATFR
jgi:hypothetical protein